MSEATDIPTVPVDTTGVTGTDDASTPVVTDPSSAAIVATQYAVAGIIKSTYSHYIIFGCAIFALCWAGWCTLMVSG